MLFCILTYLLADFEFYKFSDDGDPRARRSSVTSSLPKSSFSKMVNYLKSRVLIFQNWILSFIWQRQSIRQHCHRHNLLWKCHFFYAELGLQVGHELRISSLHKSLFQVHFCLKSSKILVLTFYIYQTLHPRAPPPQPPSFYRPKSNPPHSCAWTNSICPASAKQGIWRRLYRSTHIQIFPSVPGSDSGDKCSISTCSPTSVTSSVSRCLPGSNIRTFWMLKRGVRYTGTRVWRERKAKKHRSCSTSEKKSAK